MVDTFHPLQLTEDALEIENPDYTMSWANNLSKNQLCIGVISANQSFRECNSLIVLEVIIFCCGTCSVYFFKFII